MHELGIAASVLEIVEAAAREHGLVSVRGVLLEVGRLAGVDPEALRFALEAVAPGTVLEGAELAIEAAEGSELVVRSVSGDGPPEPQAPGSRQGLK